MTEQFEMYEALYFEGFPMGYATEKIINKQDSKNWDAILVYKTEIVTDSEFKTLQGYLNNGGTVILDSKNSLSKNEYGVKRTQKLFKGKGTLIVLDGKSDVEKIKEKTLEVITDALPEIVLSEENGTAHKGCNWRVVKNPKGGYWINILNIGKHNAKLNITFKNGEKSVLTNMLNGQELASDFELKSNGVLLIEVK